MTLSISAPRAVEFVDTPHRGRYGDSNAGAEKLSVKPLFRDELGSFRVEKNDAEKLRIKRFTLSRVRIFS
jgi:hypothetical protein